MELVNRQDAIYPESDGAPLGETGLHAIAVFDLMNGLRTRYMGQDVLVGTNQFCYYEEGEPRSVVCPDLYVVFGVDPSPRRTWKTWEEGGFLHVIIELLSRSTSANDLGPKRQLYERLGVEEYFTFDLLSEIAPPRLHGWRRCGGRFVDIPPEPGPDETLRSERLGLLLRAEGESLRLIDAHSGENLLFLQEGVEQRAEAKSIRRDAEAAQREAEAAQREAEAAQREAEAEAARLRAELSRLRRREP